MRPHLLTPPLCSQRRARTSSSSSSARRSTSFTSLRSSSQLGQLRKELLTWGCEQSANTDSAPCKNQRYAKSLSATKDAAEKQKLIQDHLKEVQTMTPTQKVAAADASWAAMKSMFKGYCAMKADSKVCSNAVLAKTYNAETRPKPGSLVRKTPAAAPAA